MEASSALHSGAGSWSHQRKGQGQTVHRKGDDTRERGERPDVGEGSRERGRHSERSGADRRGMVAGRAGQPGAPCTSAPARRAQLSRLPGGSGPPKAPGDWPWAGQAWAPPSQGPRGSSVGPLRTQVLTAAPPVGPTWKVSWLTPLAGSGWLQSLCSDPTAPWGSISRACCVSPWSQRLELKPRLGEDSVSGAQGVLGAVGPGAQAPICGTVSEAPLPHVPQLSVLRGRPSVSAGRWY